MDEIELAIRSTWSRLSPQLARDAGELQRRLDRATKLRTLARPPRAWCLAIRASDTRFERFACTSDSVLLDRAAIIKLTAPITLDAPGELVAAVAARLGTTPGGLRRARIDGVFRTHYLRGGRGKPRPLLYTDQPLDPASRGFAPADPVWSWTATYLPSRLPRDLPPQELTRVAHYRGRGPDYNRDLDELHPEHPARDGSTSSPHAARRSLKLPPPPPDYVAYKWKDGVYVGHDWKNPAARAAYFKKEEQLARTRQRVRQKRRDNPVQSKSKGSIQFAGWRWRCPKCGRKVNVLFMPVAPVNLLNDEVGTMNNEVNRAIRRHLSSRSSLIVHHSSFLCERCSQTRRFSRCDPNAWNEIITYLSGGLLYGREVQRPIWFPRISRTDRARSDDPHSEVHIRKLNYVPRPNRAPSQRRPQIESMLLKGMTFAQIAAKLTLAKGTVLWTARQIYKQHGVTNFRDLVMKLGHAELAQSPRYKTKEIRRRILQGQSVPQIAEELGVPKMMIYNQRQMMRKRGTKLKDGRKANRVGMRANATAGSLRSRWT